MIRAILIINTSGKPRLTRFYDHDITTEHKATIIRTIAEILVQKRSRSCHFFDCSEVMGTDSETSPRTCVWRQFATVNLCCIVDSSENNLAIHEFIQTFVQALDKSFTGVCELDLIYHTDVVNAVLNEMIVGGLICETDFDSLMATTKRINDAIAESKRSPMGARKGVKGGKGKIGRM